MLLVLELSFPNLTCPPLGAIISRCSFFTCCKSSRMGSNLLLYRLTKLACKDRIGSQ